MKITNDKELNNLLITKFKKNKFKKIQLKIIKSILSGQDTLVVLPTGFGKSLCFQLPGLHLNGTTIVISPLISLMQDQVKQLKKLKINATYINSSLSPYEVEIRLSKLFLNHFKLIYVAPERLNNHDFLNICQNIKIPLIVIDEAHCISSWGQDFRPNYNKISEFIKKLKIKPIIAAFTATATMQVISDIKKSLKMKKPNIFHKTPIRKNLELNIIHCNRKDKQLLQLLTILKKHKNQSGIIFTLTRATTEKLNQNLLFFNFKSHFNKILIYHGGQTSVLRKQTQTKFVNSDKNLMIATNAFGMGVNKANIRFIIHFQCPSSIESYCQEIGRAGRDLKRAKCYLLFNPTDLNIHRHFILSTSKKLFFRHDKNFLRKVKKLQQMINICINDKCITEQIKTYFSLTDEKNAKLQSNKLNIQKKCQICSHCRKITKILPKKIKAIKKKYEKNKSLIPTISYDFITILEPKNVNEYKKIPGVGDGIIKKLLALSPQA